MKLTTMFFAESANMDGDTLQVKGGMWDGLTATQFPASHQIEVVIVLEPSMDDVGASTHVDLNVVGPNGEKAGHNHVDVTLNQYKPQTAVVMTVPGTFDVAGEYTVKLQSKIGDMERRFLVVGREVTEITAAVEGYALGLNK